MTEPKNHLERTWWEPYLFTAGVLIAFAIVLIAFGFVARIRYVEPMFFVLATIVAVHGAIRASSASPTVIGKVLLAGLFALASAAYFSKAERLLGCGFAGMALVWLGLSIHAGVIQRARRKEQLTRLDRAVETLSRASPDVWKETG